MKYFSKHLWAIYSSIKHKSWCPHCVPTLKITIDQIRKIAKSKKGVLLSKGITKGKEKLEFKCGKNHLFERTGVEIESNKWFQIAALFLEQNLNQNR